jgi:hypothetical protein
LRWWKKPGVKRMMKSLAASEGRTSAAEAALQE